MKQKHILVVDDEQNTLLSMEFLLEAANERLKLSEEVLARTQRKREENLIDEVDIIRATDAVRIIKQNQV